MILPVAHRLISLLQTLEFYAEAEFQEEIKQEAYREVADSLAGIDRAQLGGYLDCLHNATRLRLANLTQTQPQTQET